MKILISGSNGLLGTKVVEILSNQKKNNWLATSKGINRILNIKNSYLDMDVTDLDSVQNVFNKFKPDVLLNCSGMTNVELSEVNQEECLKINVDGLYNLIKMCSEFKTKLYHLSTDFIFDGLDEKYPEDSIANPLSFYGLSKLKGEELIIENFENYSILRTALVYGFSKYHNHKNYLFWGYNELKNGNEIKVVNDQFRCPTWVDDLANGCLLAIEYDVNGIFNLCGKNFYSILEIYKIMADTYGLDKSLIYEVDSNTLNQKAKRPAKTFMPIEKAKSHFGYNPRCFEDGMKKTIDEYINFYKNK